MMVIGIDSHKDHLAACLIEETGRAVEHRLIGNTSRGHAELAAWAQHLGVGRVAVEGSGSYGRPAALVLLQAGVNVVEVPPQMTAHARRGQRTGTKTDPSDALLIARIAARDDDLPPPRPDGPTEDLRCVTAYRRELVKSRNQHINRLHGDLEQTRCGYHRKISGVLSSPKTLTRVSRLLSGNTSTRAQIARRRIRHIRELNRQITEVTTEIASLVTAVNTTLTNIYGIGALTAAEILAETGDPARFATKDKFAMANGTAPLQASSGRIVRHRLNRGGNRQLNKAIHTAAIAQIAKPHSEGHHYYQRCLDRGNSNAKSQTASGPTSNKPPPKI
ncbi:MAG: IS110 family transposase [Actinomycetia bacterium]|nr:IS110 family transposase [Actinomycetes bacterium]